jgi:hypothetical protein
MSESHPLDWYTASDVAGGKPWIALIASGAILEGVGGLIIGLAFNYSTTDPVDGGSHASVPALTIGSIVAAIGFAVLLLGLIALGVYLGTRHLYGRLPMTEKPATRPVTSRPGSGSGQQGDDRTMFQATEGDSPVVAQVRAMYLNGAQFALKATTASVRRITNRAQHRGQLSPADRAEIESMIVEAHRHQE